MREGKGSVRVAAAALVATVAVLAGCTSPYVKPPETSGRITLPGAFDLSRSYHLAYRQKIVDLGDQQRYGLDGLVTLAGALVALGSLSGHTIALRNGAVVGGTAYTIGLLHNDRRQAVIYVAGMKALECVNDVFVPLLIDADSEANLRSQVAEIERDTGTLEESTTRLQLAYSRVAPGTSPGDAALKQADKAFSAAQAAIERAMRADTAGRELLLKEGMAGEQMRNAVLRIDGAVTDGIRGTEVPLQMLPTILAQLTDHIALFGKPATPPGAGGLGEAHSGRASPRAPGGVTKSVDAAVAALEAAASDVLDRSKRLDAKSARIENFVNAVASRIDGARLAKCEVHAPKLKLKPSTVRFTEKAQETHIVEVRDGKPDYTMTFVPSKPDGVTATFSLKGASTWILALQSQKDELQAPAHHELVVTDLDGEVARLAIDVVKADETTSDPAASVASLTSRIQGLSPLAVAGGAKVDIISVSPREGGDLTVKYKPQGGATVKDSEVTDAINADPEVKKLLGTRRIVSVSEPS